MSSVTPTPATSTNVAANLVDSGPRHGSNSIAAQPVADRDAGVVGEQQIAVVVHHHDTDQRDRAHDVGPGEARRGSGGWSRSLGVARQRHS